MTTATMTEAYRTEQLIKAKTESAAARSRYDAAKSKKARRDAALDMEFWSNKSAFFANIRL